MPFSDLTYAEGPLGITIPSGDVLLATVTSGATLHEVQSGVAFVSQSALQAFVDAGGIGPLPHGTDGDDTLIGTDQAELLDGNAGDDLMIAGDDTESGGRDETGLAIGADLLRGGEGDDTLVGGLRHHALLGGAGDDLIIGGDGGAQELNGGDGDDTIIGGTADSIQITPFFSLPSEIWGGEGDDLLIDGDGNYALDGGMGADTIVADDFTRITGFDRDEDQLVFVLEGVAPAEVDISIQSHPNYYRMTLLGWDLVVTLRAADTTVLGRAVLPGQGAQWGPSAVASYDAPPMVYDAWIARIGFMSPEELATAADSAPVFA
jgi:Ca2+-binding RTX toxin-like protein